MAVPNVGNFFLYVNHGRSILKNYEANYNRTYNVETTYGIRFVFLKLSVFSQNKKQVNFIRISSNAYLLFYDVNRLRALF